MNLKKLLPIENFVLSTKLSPEEVRKKIAENIEPIRPAVFSFSPQRFIKPYQGYLTGNYFSISRVINYRNSFLPQIKGEIFKTGQQTEIRVNMKLHVFVVVLLSVWLGIVGIDCLITTLGIAGYIASEQTQTFPPLFLIPYGMFLFGCALTYFAFKPEAAKSKKFLTDLFEATEETSVYN